VPVELGATGLSDAGRKASAAKVGAARAVRQAARAKRDVQATKQARTTWQVLQVRAARVAGQATANTSTAKQAVGAAGGKVLVPRSQQGWSAPRDSDAPEPTGEVNNVERDHSKPTTPTHVGGTSDTAVITRCGTLSGEYEAACPLRVGEVVTIGDSVFPTTGFGAARQVAAVDEAVVAFMLQEQIPNIALAVVSGDGRLVHVRGFTNCLAYTLAQENVYFAGPDSKFRVASVSKVLTGLATLKLLELGLLPDLLNGHLSDFVDTWTTPEPTWGVVGYDVDPWLADVRISHCLTHTGGWVREASLNADKTAYAGIYPRVIPLDPVDALPVADVLQELPECAGLSFATMPTSPQHLLRYGNLADLALEPGSHYCYSNYGFWMLGQVIEGATCRSYESVVHEYILKPLGARNTFIGDTSLRYRKVGEVPYFAAEWPREPTDWEKSVMQSNFSGTGFPTVRLGSDDFNHADTADSYAPYANHDLRLGPAGGGWVSSAYDLALLMRDLFVGPSVILSEDVVTNYALAHATFRNDGHTAGQTLCGLDWDGDTYAKNGHLTGTHAFTQNLGEISTSAASGASLVLLYNRYYGEDVPSGATDLRARMSHFEGNIALLLKAVTNWGTDDLFDA